MKKYILSLLFVLGLIGSASAQTPTGDLANGLVSFYSFNGNANDSVGGNNGTAYGATQTADQFGNPIGAYYFDGINNYINTTARFSTGNAAKSFSIWFNPSVIKRGWLIDGGLNQDGQAFGLFYESNYSPGLLFHGNNTYDVLVSNDTQAGYWYNAVVTYDGSTLDCYLNGTLRASSTVTLNTSFSDILIGSRLDASNSEQPTDAYFKGVIDNVGIWNTALSSSQVSQLYTLQSAPEPSTYALFGIGAIGMLMVMRRKKTV
jgi:hypothetical protein